ncbi:hypothetical protein QI633_22935 [Nocardioides sp. QY071]|uniref:hypothetical protein n=1 Tax=Nocardioides sp. QY071 TaxID=3044187 RepID=UPI00249AAFFB|nr:hypothetical protein [Nocardioides sp. QY071]WGY01379.1 hypothetical protein QI633_22935 [Nocardioides sp. QY071]
MNRPITDAGVAGLPIREGRAELLEEIMSLAPVETTEPAPVRRHRRVLPVLAAAAAVLAVVGGVAWLGLQRDPQATGPVPLADGPGAGPGELAVLTAPGWSVTYVTDDPKSGGELDYEHATDDSTLEIMWRPAKLYDAYVVDRNDIGTPVDVDLLGKRSLMWAYGKRDHTVIRPVEGRFSLEVRGSGMDETAFRAVLAQLELVGHDQLQQHLPDEAILDDERAAAIDEALTGIPLPSTLSRADILSTGLTHYEVVADVTAAVTCAWIDWFESARSGHRAAAVEQAQQALATAHDWPALEDIADEGGWSDAIWQYADIVVAGAPTARDQELLDGRFDGIGCPGGGSAGGPAIDGVPAP